MKNIIIALLLIAISFLGFAIVSQQNKYENKLSTMKKANGVLLTEIERNKIETNEIIEETLELKSENLELHKKLNKEYDLRIKTSLELAKIKKRTFL